MQEEPNTMDFDNGVIVTCVEGKYIGSLLGSDDIYLYMKFTHKAKEVYPVVTAEAVVGVAALIAKRPLWLLRIQVAVKYKINPIGMDREALAQVLAIDLMEEAIKEGGPVETYIAQPQAIKIALPHTEILRFESLTDVTTGAILTGLDFPVGSVYNEEHDNTGSSTEVPPKDN